MNRQILEAYQVSRTSDILDYSEIKIDEQQYQQLKNNDIKVVAFEFEFKSLKHRFNFYGQGSLYHIDEYLDNNILRISYLYDVYLTVTDDRKYLCEEKKIPGLNVENNNDYKNVISLITNIFNLMSTQNQNFVIDSYESFKDFVVDQFVTAKYHDILLRLSSVIGNDRLSNIKIFYSNNLLEFVYNCNLAIMASMHSNNLDKEIEQILNKSIEKNQTEYILREKIRAIKEKLGDKYSDLDKFRSALDQIKFPPEVVKKIENEISKLDNISSNSSEYGVIYTYLEWLISLPWDKQTIDCDDLNLIEQKLDEQHYGLKKVKERILEYIAVKKLTNSLKSPILCLVGPPGVGKTSLAKSIAEALNRQFVKISLGGVRDESEIRGHRRTYLGALPGKIIYSLRKAESNNPVFLIDEIDKLASDYKGDPASALLEVLDPEQNAKFTDHYIEESFDLSSIMFIATANYLYNIPEALRDRLEIIELSSYTEEEKLNIVRNSLLSRSLAETGLSKKNLEISDEIILEIIRYYTKESGVRNLQRILSAICRKVALEVAKGDKKRVRITKKNLVNYLGKAKFSYGAKLDSAMIGIVNGLAYTAYGGDILQVEVNTYDGDGKVVTTGQLGDVMKESIQIALSYLKANCDKFGIDLELFNHKNIHIHFPEGAVPKDGPSAGVTITTALYSAFTQRKVKADIAMTGEVNLRGQVLAIGGLKEKTLAAYRSGIKTVFIPHDNLRDLDELATVVKEQVKIIAVKSVDEILKRVIVNEDKK